MKALICRAGQLGQWHQHVHCHQDSLRTQAEGGLPGARRRRRTSRPRGAPLPAGKHQPLSAEVWPLCSTHLSGFTAFPPLSRSAPAPCVTQWPAEASGPCPAASGGGLSLSRHLPSPMVHRARSKRQ